MVDLFVSAPAGCESLLAEELEQLSVSTAGLHPGGLTCSNASLMDMARIHVGSYLASNVLLRLGSFPAMHLDALQTKAAKLPWHRYIVPGQPVKVRASCRHSRIYHSGAAAERVQAAIEGALLSHCADAINSNQPSPQPVAPQAARIVVDISSDRATVSIDASGEPLYRRGYRQQTAKAPMRENIAAACLRFCGWHTGRFASILDPMCGSGTLIIEAALMATQRAPGAGRHFAFESWPRCPAGLVDGALGEEGSSIRPGADVMAWGSDRDAGAVAAARANAERARIAEVLRFERRAVTAARSPPGPLSSSHATRCGSGLLICNPPYGKRIGDAANLRDLYAALGNTAREHFRGWHVAIITPNPNLVRATGFRDATISAPISHGGLKIRTYLFSRF